MKDNLKERYNNFSKKKCIYICHQIYNKMMFIEDVG